MPAQTRFALGDEVSVSENSSARRGLWNEVGRVTGFGPGLEEPFYWVLFIGQPTSTRVPESALRLHF